MYKLGIEQDRGILEIGAGNGYWSHAVKKYYLLQKQNKLPSSSSMPTKSTKSSDKVDENADFIVAFDDYSSIPLATSANNSTNHVVRRGNHVDAINFLKEEKESNQQQHYAGRILLLVYPPPGNMAYESVMEYTKSNPNLNDTIVYIGEGRDGANANKDFFDYFCCSNSMNNANSDDNNDCNWSLIDVMDVWHLEDEVDLGRSKSRGGRKSLEKCFTFKRAHAD